MKKIISLLFLSISLYSLAGVDLEIKGVIGKEKENDTTAIKLNARTIISMWNFDIIGGNYNGEMEEKNSLKNIELMYDGRILNFDSGYQIKESNDNTFSETNSIFSKISTDLKYKRMLCTPYVSQRYNETEGKEENHKYGTGVSIGYFFTEKISMFSKGEYYERKDSRGDKEELGIKGEYKAGDFKISQEVSAGGEKNDFEEREVYIRSNIEMSYSAGENIILSVVNYNETSESYRTNKTTLIGTYVIDKTDMGNSKAMLLASYNDKGVYGFERYEMSVNKFINDFEIETGLSIRRSEVREVYSGKVRANFYFMGNNKIFFDVSRENIKKYVVNDSGINRYEIGMSVSF